jgi:type II secretory pathway component PulF
MPAFAYTARGLDGRTLKGVRVAGSEEELHALLAQDRLFLLKANAQGAARTGVLRVKRREQVAFLVHLGSYIEAGVPILAALADYRIPERPPLDAAIMDIRRRIEGGASLSEAFEAHPGFFSPLHVAMVRAGESSGRLDEALREVVKLVEWEEAFAGQMQQASTYPLIVLGVIGLAILAASIFAFPPILKMLREFNVPMPLPTRIFMGIGGFMADWGWLVVLGPLGLYIAHRFALRDEAYRLGWDTRLLTMPLVGGLVTRLGLSRFATFFAAQFRAGIPMIQILRECEGVTGNARLALCVRRIREGVEGGERLAVMAASVGYFPLLVVRMLAIGEEAGNLEQTLARVSSYFDAEVQTGVKRFFQLLEPLIIVGLASMLVFVALAILLPIYTLIGGINAGAQ